MSNAWFGLPSVATPVQAEAAKPEEDIPLFRALSAHVPQQTSPTEFLETANRSMRDMEGVVLTASSTHGAYLIACCLLNAEVQTQLISTRSRDRLYEIVDEAAANWRRVTSPDKSGSDLARRISNALDTPF